MNRTGSQQDVGLSMYATTRKAMSAFLRPLSALLNCLVCLPRLRRTQSLVRQCSSERRSSGLFLPAGLRSLRCSRAFFSVSRCEWWSVCFASVVDSRRVVQFLECYSGDMLLAGH
jgi:hypothetical protein